MFSESLDHIDQSLSLWHCYACSARWLNGISLLLASFFIKISMCEYRPILWPSYLRGKQMSQTILISELSYYFVFKCLLTLTDEAAETPSKHALMGSIAQGWEHWPCKPGVVSSNLAGACFRWGRCCDTSGEQPRCPSLKLHKTEMNVDM